MKTPVIGCKWCGKKLGAKFDRVCKDCGHTMYWHPFAISATQKNCRRTEECACTAVQSQKFNERSSEQFPRRKIGSGLDAKGLFCTQACAVNWAHKYAGTESTEKIRHYEYALGTIANMAVTEGAIGDEAHHTAVNVLQRFGLRLKKAQAE